MATLAWAVTSGRAAEVAAGCSSLQEAVAASSAQSPLQASLASEGTAGTPHRRRLSQAASELLSVALAVAASVAAASAATGILRRRQPCQPASAVVSVV